mmetsp:Transcript_24792/g.50800  ORF Transcript_24792/g.50800 Transcript_24792/m.50800 type:complete len:1003 (-) Transcript_24792:2182-5190(-)
MAYSIVVGVENGAGTGLKSSELDGVVATNPKTPLLPYTQINDSDGYQDLGIEERQAPLSSRVVCDRNGNNCADVISVDEKGSNPEYANGSYSQNKSEESNNEETERDSRIKFFGPDSSNTNSWTRRHVKQRSLKIGKFPSSVHEVPEQIVFDQVSNSSSTIQNGKYQHDNGENRYGGGDDDSNRDGKKRNNKSSDKYSNQRGGNGEHSNANSNSRNNRNNFIEGNGHGDDDESTDTHTPQNNNSQQDHEQQQSEAAVEEEQQTQLLFSCQCDSARTIATLLSCLRRVVTSNTSGPSGTAGTNHRGGRTSLNASTAAGTMGETSSNKVQHATVYAGPSGLTFHVQHGLAKQSQCSVDMPKGLFRDYFVGEEEVWLEDSEDEGEDDNDEEIDGVGGTNGKKIKRNATKEIIQGGEFAINLTTVLECFSILSRNNKSMQSVSIQKSGGSGGISSNPSSGEYASLDRVPLCMSYDRGTALFHLEFLEGGNLLGTGPNVDASTTGGGVLVTCEVPGVAVSDDVDDGPDDDDVEHYDHSSVPNQSSNTGLASAFRSSPLLARAILYSEALQAAIAELYDVPGASIVQVAFSKEGMELGTVGSRSEVWVSVPYHCNQQGMYVGMECYNIESVARYSDGYVSNPSKHVRKYPLGTFLSGMRGLDIGCETCISVNSRGMMAIQHQVTREGYYEGSDGAEVRPSFVDFIMTCIEEVDEMEEDATAQNVGDEEQESHHWTGSQRNEELDLGTRQRADSVESIRRKRNHDEASPARGCLENDDQRDNEHDLDVDSSDEDQAQGKEKRTEPSATSRILGELELDQDLVSSKRKSHDRRKSALEDIRRRREGISRQSADDRKERDTNNTATADSDVDAASNGGSVESSNGNVGKKRPSGSSDKAKSRKTRHSEKNNRNTSEADKTFTNGNRDSQSLADEDDDDSELEESLDVTTEIPQLFSRPSSMSTSRRRSRGNANNAGDMSDGDESEEPKMMYGDTRLEFTQDGYQSGTGSSM